MDCRLPYAPMCVFQYKIWNTILVYKTLIFIFTDNNKFFLFLYTLAFIF